LVPFQKKGLENRSSRFEPKNSWLSFSRGSGPPLNKNQPGGSWVVNSLNERFNFFVVMAPWWQRAMDTDHFVEMSSPSWHLWAHSSIPASNVRLVWCKSEKMVGGNPLIWAQQEKNLLPTMMKRNQKKWRNKSTSAKRMHHDIADRAYGTGHGGSKAISKQNNIKRGSPFILGS